MGAPTDVCHSELKEGAGECSLSQLGAGVQFGITQWTVLHPVCPNCRTPALSTNMCRQKKNDANE
jgi:hypothetical protein